MDGKDRFNFGSRVSFRFVPGFSVSRFTTTCEHNNYLNHQYIRTLYMSCCHVATSGLRK